MSKVPCDNWKNDSLITKGFGDGLACLLLCNQKGPTSFEDLRTVNGYLYPTYRDAARAVGYLENDRGDHQMSVHRILQDIMSNDQEPFSGKYLFYQVTFYKLYLP
ncbi:Helitron helicase-like protein [Phytophthora palmivora]|uniref:Helitron helicase-like protein n=1 Tax=Phytophthora palmivora TaxID=4796 RepID=A0A2P4X4Z8_9STRA|nr:Helitron helicase-like protein [Phytophthora palmivora]